MDILQLVLVFLIFINTVILILAVPSFGLVGFWFFSKLNSQIAQTSCLLAEIIDLVKVSKSAIERVELEQFIDKKTKV